MLSFENDENDNDDDENDNEKTILSPFFWHPSLTMTIAGVRS